MKTIDYIYNGSKHIVGMNLTKAFDKYLAENKGEYVFLVPNSCLVDKWSLEKLFEKYYPCVFRFNSVAVTQELRGVSLQTA